MADQRAQVILTGGFLGAGKTTLLLAAAERLAAQGRRVGLVTNDQGAGLVDTALAAHYQVPVAEVAGGCFCCRFPDLLTALEQLQAQVEPDVILAEPVGSCTDLAATVLLPLTRYYGDRFTVAPLTVLVDGSRDTTRLSPRVAYLYHQQLAEAELVALNKLDLLSPEQQTQKATDLRLAYPDTEVLGLAAGRGTGVDEWLAAVLGQESRLGRVLDLDYELYAEAEAGLAWLNAQAVARGDLPFAADALAARLLQELARRLTEQGAAIAHLKLVLHAPGVMLKGSVTEAGRPVYWDEWRPDTLADRAQIILNVRAEAEPPVVEASVKDLLAETAQALRITCTLTHLESFSPAAPQPTYRLGQPTH